MYGKSYFLLGLVAVISTTVAKIPSYIHICQANDQDIGGCIINSVNELRPRLKSGIPELDVPALEPLHLDEIKLRRGPSTAQIDANLTDLVVWGATGFQILELKPNIAKNRFAFKVKVPYLHFEGKYDLDMRILLVQYKGKGPIFGNFTDYAFDCIMKGKKVQRDGEEYLKFDKMRMRLFIGKSELRLDNLFNSDPLLGRATNQIVNENSDIFINEIKPVLENSLSEKFTEIANRITLRFTYKELFP